MRYSQLTRALFVIVALLGLSEASAQTIQNVKASFLGGTTTIQYDIVGGPADQKYLIEIFGSHNNFSTALKSVTGDVGKDVSAGVGKKIEWNAQAELGTFKGEVTFRIRGNPVLLPLAFKTPAISKARRGKTTVVQWSGGNPAQNATLELMQGEKLIQSFGATKNSGTYNWAVAPDLAKGTYSLKLSSGGQVTQSPPFPVKAKTPVAFIVVPAVAVVGVVIILLSGGDPPPPPDDDLPNAPTPSLP